MGLAVVSDWQADWQLLKTVSLQHFKRMRAFIYSKQSASKLKFILFPFNGFYNVFIDNLMKHSYRTRL